MDSEGSQPIGAALADKANTQPKGRDCLGNRGFLFELPAELRDGKPHVLYAYVMNLSRQSGILLTQSPLPFKIGPAEFQRGEVASRIAQRVPPGSAGHQKGGPVRAGRSSADASNDPNAPLALWSVKPRTIKSRVGYNVQPDGSSALELSVANARQGTVAVLGETRLRTFYGSATFLSVNIPQEIVARPQTASLYLVDGKRRSNAIEFRIEPSGLTGSALAAASPATTPLPGAAKGAPLLLALHPASTRLGVAFNVQPGGGSAIAASCVNAQPGWTIVFDGKPLATVYGGPTLLSAKVPKELYQSSGPHTVYLASGHSESNRLEFKVLP